MRLQEHMKIESNRDEALVSFAASIRNATIEEIATFAETHYCIMDADEPSGYKICERKKHPNEPFARAIRGLKHA